MAKLYLASLKFSPSLWVIISSIGKVFCCQIRDLEIKFNIYKKSVDVLSWWSECYTLKNNNTNNSSIIIITKEGDLPLWNHVRQNKLIFLRKEFLEKLQHEINGLLVNSDFFFFHFFLLLLFFPNHSLWFFFFFLILFSWFWPIYVPLLWKRGRWAKLYVVGELYMGLTTWSIHKPRP